MESCRGAAATGGGGRQWRHVHVAALAAALLLACGPSQAAVHLHESFDGLEADQWREKFTHSASSKHEGRFELAGAGDWDPADKALKVRQRVCVWHLHLFGYLGGAGAQLPGMSVCALRKG